MYRKWYEKLYLRLFLGAVILLAVLAVQLIREQKREWEMVLVKAVLPGKVITDEMLSRIDDFPGLCKRWLLLEKDCEIRIGGYHAQVRITGVDLSGYPLEVKASAGKKAAGNMPLLAVGETFFSRLADENGNSITERQAEILMRKIGELEAEITLEKTGESGKKASSDAAQFLAIIKGDGVWMEAAQMQRWLQSRREQARAGSVVLEIQGIKNAEGIKTGMEKAGFTVEIMEKPAL